MKNYWLTLMAMLMVNLLKAQLQIAATSNTVWNGVTTVGDRIFVCFPRLEGDSGMRIGEVLPGGNIVPYPNAAWNNWRPGNNVDNTFIRANSLRIGPDGLLWVVDTGTPALGEAPLPGNAAKLVAIDPHTNKVVRTVPLAGVSRKNTFIDDLRMYGNTIYLTDAGEPALVVMNKTTGKGRRVLENHTSTTDEIAIRAEGKIMTDNKGHEIRIHADQLEVSPDGRWLYYQPASGPLWRVETHYLQDTGIDEKSLAQQVSLFYKTPSTGGTAIDADGNLYVSDVDQQQIIRISPEGKAETILKDPRLAWCDALWMDEKGYLWLPAGQLNRLAAFQQGISKLQLPVVIYKIKTGARPFKS